MKFVFTLVSMLMSTLALAYPADSVRLEQRSDGRYVIHQVDDQETLYSIAKRYGGSVAGIIQVNGIVDSKINIGQLLAIRIEEKKPVKAKVIQDKMAETPGQHFVEPGETLYAISRKYDVKVKQLKKWNNLEGNDISPGMILTVIDRGASEIGSSAGDTATLVVNDTSQIERKEHADPYADFEKYFVQTGETLHTIAAKIGVQLDSLRAWNKLQGDYLKIGQELFFRKDLEVEDIKLSEPKKKLRTQVGEDGFERMYEEGIVSVIESMNTSRFLALHRDLPIGTDLEVRNLMNNQVVFVKVVGKLPATGPNKNILLRISRPAYEQLGILDSKSRVEVSYIKN